MYNIHDLINSKRFLESHGYSISMDKEKFRESVINSNVADEDMTFDDVIDFDKPTRSLREALEEEDSEESDLCEDSDEYEVRSGIPVGDQKREYRAGDIVEPRQAYSEMSGKNTRPHPILILKSMPSGKIVDYIGILFSTQTDKSNLKNPKNPTYWNNIFIGDPTSVAHGGRGLDKQSFLQVNDRIHFTNIDLPTEGAYIGHINPQFYTFIKQCIKNAEIDGGAEVNKELYWDGSYTR